MTTPITLVLRDGPQLLALERLTVGNAVLRLNDTVANGRWLVCDLQHPAFGAAGLSTAARVTWSQQIAPGLPLWLAGVEFTGSWESLGTLRRALLGVLASQALAPEGPVGFVTREPDGTWTCHSAQTIKVAMISAEGAGFTVRRRDDRDPAGLVLPTATFSEALACAFDRADAPRLDPPIGPASAPKSGAMQRPAATPSTPAAPAKPAAPEKPAKRSAAEAYEDAVLAARTVVLQPERPRISESSEDAILASSTMVVAPEPPMSQSSEDAILAARTIIDDDDPPPAEDDSTAVIIRKLQAAAPPPAEPSRSARPASKADTKPPTRPPARPDSKPAAKPDSKPAARPASAPPRSEPMTRSNKRWSKVLAGGVQVGWIAPDTPTAWSTYDDEGRKTAVISAEEGVVRVCWLGDQATESFEYFEAPTAKEAIVVAFELTAEPKIEPPLAGLF